MSRNNSGAEIDLNAPPPRENRRRAVPRLALEPEPSPAVSCVTSDGGLTAPGSPSEILLKGCPGCLMYLMLLRDVRTCPRCKGAVFELIDYVADDGDCASSVEN